MWSVRRLQISFWISGTSAQHQWTKLFLQRNECLQKNTVLCSLILENWTSRVHKCSNMQPKLNSYRHFSLFILSNISFIRPEAPQLMENHGKCCKRQNTLPHFRHGLYWKCADSTKSYFLYEEFFQTAIRRNLIWRIDLHGLFCKQDNHLFNRELAPTEDSPFNFLLAN